MKEVRGYKVFNPDWTCRDKQYACPGHFEESGDISICKTGMHFCKKASDCFNYHSFDPKNKVAEVLAYGSVIENGDECCTDKLEIVREISWHELLEIVNIGKGCTGRCNSGDCNTGDYNSGDCNSGSWNVGNWNSGNWNSGDFNSGDSSNGCFNTESPKIYLFNRLSEWTYKDWLYSEARYIMKQIFNNVLEYVCFSDMTDEEKATHPEAEITGGYLKMVDHKKMQESWDNLPADEKETIKAIPNFDKEIFKEITGIDVEKHK